MEVTGTGTAATIADVDDLTDLDVIAALGAPIRRPPGRRHLRPVRHPDERRVAPRHGWSSPTPRRAPRAATRPRGLCADRRPDDRRLGRPGAPGPLPRRQRPVHLQPGHRVLASTASCSSASTAPARAPARPSFVVRQRPTDALGSVSAAVTLSSGDRHLSPAQRPRHRRRRARSAGPRRRLGRERQGHGDRQRDRPSTTSSGPPRPARSTARRSPPSPRSACSTRATASGLPGRSRRATPRSFQVAGVGTIPDDAIAVTANVTVTGQTASGYVSLTPSPTPTRPARRSTSRPATTAPTTSPSPSTRPARSPRSSSRAPARRRTSSSTSPATSWPTTSEATYKPVPPVRLLDTRFGNGLSGSFLSNTPRSVPIRGRGGIPQAAIAISANLTVTGQTSGGYVSLTPSRTRPRRRRRSTSRTATHGPTA